MYIFLYCILFYIYNSIFIKIFSIHSYKIKIDMLIIINNLFNYIILYIITYYIIITYNICNIYIICNYVLLYIII